MSISKYFRLFKPVGTHKRIVKLMEVKQTLSIIIIGLFILFEVGAFSYITKKVLNMDVELKEEFSKNIAVLNIDEVITSEYVQRLIDRVQYIQEHQEQFPELLVVMNCPGGSATASEEMRRFLDDLQKEGTHVTMYVEGLAASGGYYIASTARYDKKDKLSGIISNQNAMVGSIGVFLGYPIIEEAAKKLGVTQKVITIGKYKHPISMFKSPTNEEEHYIKEQVMRPIYNNFLKIVAKGRNLSVENMQTYAEGKVFIASEVVGPLVDRVSYLYQVKKEIKQRVKTNYDETDVGFVMINTAKERTSLLDTKLDLQLNTDFSQGGLNLK